MISRILNLAVAMVAIASSVLAQEPLTIDTPAVARQCEPTLITWHGGTGLFFLLVRENGEPIQEFGGLPADIHNFTWQTNVREGTLITFELADDAREDVTSAPFVIQYGPNNCTLVN
ncbi:hypothetical protein BC628DRAFT_1405362 [Trametes gibbosa]|nr:hypothetical protein BC628DRAFT_1405362 [Trametes gibbosa]